MANLRDMEELLETIADQRMKEYMSEALACYMTSAYRGCIVLSYIALFDDIVAKLGQLAMVNSAARTILVEVEKRMKAQDVFENYLVEQLAKSNILSSLETSALAMIRDRRNKAAHPSGHAPSAEEARFIYSEAITKFLCNPQLVTTALVDEILLRLTNQNFFPNGDIDDVAAIVRHEIERLNAAAYPYLFHKLITMLDSGENPQKKNAFFFMNGLARHSESEQSVTDLFGRKLVMQKLDDEKYSTVILSCLTANPQIIEQLDEISIKRLQGALTRQVDNLTSSDYVKTMSHPSQFFNAFLQWSGVAKCQAWFGDRIEYYLRKYPYDIRVLTYMMQEPALYSQHVAVLMERASSSTYGIANEFAEKIVGMEAKLSELISPQDALKLILAILRAASWGAWGAQQLRDEQFNSIGSLKSKAKVFLATNDPELPEIFASYNVLNWEDAKERYFG